MPSAEEKGKVGAYLAIKFRSSDWSSDAWTLCRLEVPLFCKLLVFQSAWMWGSNFPGCREIRLPGPCAPEPTIVLHTSDRCLTGASPAVETGISRDEESRLRAGLQPRLAAHKRPIHNRPQINNLHHKHEGIWEVCLERCKQACRARRCARPLCLTRAASGGG